MAVLVLAITRIVADRRILVQHLHLRHSSDVCLGLRMKFSLDEVSLCLGRWSRRVAVIGSEFCSFRVVVLESNVCRLRVDVFGCKVYRLRAIFLIKSFICLHDFCCVGSSHLGSEVCNVFSFHLCFIYFETNEVDKAIGKEIATTCGDKHDHQEFSMLLESERVIPVVVIYYIFESGTLFSVFIEALDTREDYCKKLPERRDLYCDETNQPAGLSDAKSAASEKKTSEHDGVDTSHDFKDPSPLSGLVDIARFEIGLGLVTLLSTLHPLVVLLIVVLYLQHACIGLSCTCTEVV